MVEEAAPTLEHATASDILMWAAETFGDRFCLTSSLADAVLIDVASRVVPGVRVLFLDTGYHFPETLDVAEEVAARYDVDLVRVFPRQTVSEQDAVFGRRLHDRDPDACCSLRKVEPLHRGLESYDAWASGLRRDEAVTRRSIGTVEWDANRQMVKVNPLASWTQSEVDAYILDNDVTVNPLAYRGYASIGCAPCTLPVAPGADGRSGRWAGKGKVECGLHSAPEDPSTTKS